MGGAALRIALLSDAPWAPSGYGVQADQIGRMLQSLGHEVAYIAAFGLHGRRLEHAGMAVYPGGYDGFGNDVVAPFVAEWRPDILITLKDLWVYHPEHWGPDVRWVPLVPVDHEPIPAGLVQMIRQFAYAVIGYAPYGVVQLHDAGFAPLYAPHSYDPAVFYPVEQAEARAALGLPADRLIVGMVAVNRGGYPSRKAWPENLAGFASFRQSHPGALLYCHTYHGDDQREGAVPLRMLAAELGLTDQDVVITEDRDYDAGLAPEQLRNLYSAFDFLNAVSNGEGFGVPTLEAQACGTPVLVGDWMASADLCFAGVKIPKQFAFRDRDHQHSYVYRPGPGAIAQGMADLAARLRVDAAGMRRAAAAGAAKFAMPAVRERWDTTIRTIAAQIDREPTRGVLAIVPAASVLAQEGAGE